MGVASLVLGIISLLVSFSGFESVPLICAVIAIILGIIAIIKNQGKAMGIVGLILALIGLLVLFVNPGAVESTEVVTETAVAQNETTDDGTTTDEAESLSVGDTWTVDGQWSLTINSVEATSERTELADVDPAQVVLITYSYDNLGFESDLTDGLYFNLSQNGGNASTVDADGVAAVNYPGEVSKEPQSVAVGEKCTGAQTCLGLLNTSDEIIMIITKYDSDNNLQVVTYNLKVS
jgi:hypothetical protein